MKDKIKVIDSLWIFLVATAIMGPFALPLLWRNPRYSKRTKIGGSVVVIAFTLFLLYLFKVVFVEFKEILEAQPL